MSEELHPSDALPEEPAELQKDIRLEMKIKNNVLWKAIHESYPSVLAFCRAHPSLENQHLKIYRLLNFSEHPRHKKTGEYHPICLLLGNILRIPAEELFPKELYEQFLGKKTSGAVEISFTALPGLERKGIPLLPAPQPDRLSEFELAELREQMDAVLQTLTDREREVLKLRFGITGGKTYLLTELAEIFHVSPERIRQIEIRALAKLRQPRCARCLEPFQG